MTKRLWKTGVLLLLVGLFSTIFGVALNRPTAYATNPALISFQGKVVNGSSNAAPGTNITDGSYPVTFKIYSVSSGGVALWTENDTVTVTAGVFQVNLGAVTSLSTIDFNANPTLYLGITFNSDAAGEMSPRPQLTSVPYAFNSDKVGGLTASQLVQLAPSSSQTDSSTNTSIFINKSGASGNLLQLQTGGGTPATKFTVDFSGNVTAAGTLTIQGTGTSAFSGNVTVTNSTNGQTSVTVTNSNSGTAALADYVASNGTTVGGFGVGGTAYTNFSILQNRTFVDGISNALALVTISTNPIIFGVNTAEVARFDASGNLELGTSAAATARMVIQGAGATSATAALNVTNSTPTSLLYVRDDGNVGIGNTSPSALLSVGSSSQFQVNSSGAIAAATGITTSGDISGTGRIYLSHTTGTNGQGYFIRNGSSVPITSYQGLDTGSNSFGFFGVNKYFNGTTWVDDGQSRLGSSFQIQDDSFNFYSFDTAANFTSRFVVAHGGNVGIGSNVTPGFLLDVQGGDINTSANVRTGGTIRLDNTGNLVNIGNITGTASVTLTAGTTLTLQSTTTSAVTLDSGTTGDINIGTNANAKTITIGNITGATGIVFNSGTAGVKVNTVASGQLLVTSGTNIPTVDMVSIDNTGSTGVTAAGINALDVHYKGGAAAVEGAAERIDIQPGTTSGGTWSGLRVVPNATGAVSGVTENGLNVEDLTTPGAGTENAITVGTGWDNVLQSAHTMITQAGLLTAVTINATTGYQAGGTAGITVAACTAGQYIGNGVAVKEGIITAGSCRTDATGLSDVRVKTNIVSLDSSVLDTIKQVNTVNFDFDCSNPYFTESSTDCDTRLQTGVIAQQLQQIYPQLVYTDEWGYFHVDYQGLSIETLKAVTQLAQFINATGDANLHNVTANSVSTPNITAGGALTIDSGPGGDLSFDTTDTTATVNIGTNTAVAVNISRLNQQTTVRGGLEVNQNGNFSGAVSAASVKSSGDLTATGTFNLLNANDQTVISFDQSGNATFTGNINLASASLSGGLTVGGDLNIAGLSTFQKLATFLAKTVFRQDVEFDGHITVASDTAGYATLRVGESTVHVSFAAPYENPPIVTADMTNGQFGLVGVNNVTATGFDIQLPVPVLADTTLTWTAIGVNSPITASNPLPPTTP